VQQKQRSETIFVGRKKEIDIFLRWLNNDDAPWILYLHDAVEKREKRGGVGKTWLLREYIRQARTRRPDLAIVSIDFFNVADRDRIIIAETAVQKLQEAFPAWVPVAFRKALSEYRTEGYISGLNPEKDVADIHIRDTLSSALASDLEELENHLGETGKALLLFFDTYEMIEDNPVSAVLGLIQSFPDNYHFKHMGVVLAGRNELSWTHQNWVGRREEVLDVALAPFDQEEMLDYIAAESTHDQSLQSEEIQRLYRLTEGRPILIGLATDLLNHDTMSLKDLVAVPSALFEENLVAQINSLESPLNWAVLFMSHAYHRFNMSILDWLAQQLHLRDMENINHDLMLQQLSELSFVRRPGSGNDFVLHDEMRRLVTEHSWSLQDPNHSIRREISSSLIEYSDQQSKLDLPEPDQQLYVIIKLYHTLFLDRDKGLAYFHSRFTDAADAWRSAFARSLVQEVRQFSQELTPEQHYEMILAGVRLLRTEENPSGALLEYERLEREASKTWFEAHKSDLLMEKGRCYLQLSKLLDAIDCFTKVLEIERVRGDEQQPPRVLGLLGFIHRRRGQLDIAMRYYQECINEHKRLGDEVSYATMLNNISNIHRLQGRTEEALRICKIGLRQRRRLFREKKAGERAVGLSLSTMGMIYLDSENIVLAEQVLREAFETYSRVGYRRGIAMAYNRLGEVQIAQADLKQAKELFEKARATAEGVDTEALINSLNKQGRVLALQKRWQEAAPFFQQAIEQALLAYDFYQQVESLIDLAEAYERLGQQAEAIPLWQQAYEISASENYIYLLGHIERVKGELAYSGGNYVTAFEHYRDYCRYAVQYNTIVYTRSIRRISDALLETPVEFIPTIVNSLVSSWTALGLEQNHPELVEACEEINQLMIS
jgi:tetratricopeptide (TPR) repeat protein